MASATLQKNALAFDSIDMMLREIASRDKVASHGSGKTTHPSNSESIEDDLHPVPHGERYRENDKDVKEDQGPPSVENEKEGTPGGEDSVMPNIGVEQAATGEDPAHETSSAGSEKKDGGTYKGKSTHPARTDNDALDGGKYAAARKLLESVKKTSSIGDELLSKLAVEAADVVAQRKSAHATAPAPAQSPAPAAAAAPVAKTAETSPELAAILCSKVWGNDKQAMVRDVQGAIAYTIQDAFNLAEKTAAFIQEASKQAADEHGKSEKPDDEGGSEKHDSEEEETSDDSAPATPPDIQSESGGGGGAPPGGGHDDHALLAALMGGAGGGGAPGAGGAPPMDGAGAMGAMGGGGAPPGAAPLGGAPGMDGGAGAGGPMISLPVLLAALQQAQVPAGAFQAKAAAKAAAALRDRVGVVQSDWKAKTAEEQAQFDNTLKYVRELMQSN